MKKVVIVGGGINGLVSANYLIKGGYDVTIIEKKEFTGGACIKDSKTIDGKNIDFAYGATVGFLSFKRLSILSVSVDSPMPENLRVFEKNT